jgi:hypothetical protein
MSDYPLHYGFEGQPIEMEEWLRLFDSPVRLLRQEWVLGRDGFRAWVSTVWMGIDHNFHRFTGLHREWSEEDLIDTRPWIFETMVFENGPRFDDIFARIGYGDELLQWRYATIEEALQGHEAAIEEVTQ